MKPIILKRIILCIFIYLIYSVSTKKAEEKNTFKEILLSFTLWVMLMSGSGIVLQNREVSSIQNSPVYVNSRENKNEKKDRIYLSRAEKQKYKEKTQLKKERLLALHEYNLQKTLKIIVKMIDIKEDIKIEKIFLDNYNSQLEKVKKKSFFDRQFEKFLIQKEKNKIQKKLSNLENEYMRLDTDKEYYLEKLKVFAIDLDKLD